jgi:hypothetical protein
MSSSNSDSESYADGSASNSAVSAGQIEMEQKKPAKEYPNLGSTVTYYDNIIGDFKNNETYTLGKLERMKKEADTNK